MNVTSRGCILFSLQMSVLFLLYASTTVESIPVFIVNLPEFSEIGRGGNCKYFVLVNLNCSTKVPSTRWLLNIRNLLITVLEAEKSMIREEAWLDFGEHVFLGHRLPKS